MSREKPQALYKERAKRAFPMSERSERLGMKTGSRRISLLAAADKLIAEKLLKEKEEIKKLNRLLARMHARRDALLLMRNRLYCNK